MTAYRETASQAAALRGRLRWPADDAVELLDDAVEDAASARRRARALGAQVDSEAATLAGALLDAAEASRHLGVTLRDQTTLLGRVEAVGADVLTMSAGSGSWAVVPFAAISMFEALDREGRALGDRQPVEATFASTLFGLAPLRPTVSASVAGRSERVSGRLWSCGRDICSIRSDAGRFAHIAIDAIVALRVFDLAVLDNVESGLGPGAATLRTGTEDGA